MNLHDAKKISVLPKYLYQGQFDRTDELNSRILERSQPEHPLPPNFSTRPVLSKYARFPMLDARMPPTIPIEANTNASLEKSFTPSVMNVGPVAGFLSNVSTESILRNQVYALHKGNDEAIYVPSSKSDLYNVVIPSAPSEQPHPELFTYPSFSQAPHPNVVHSSVGHDRFHNNTRTQLRNGSSKNI